MRIASEIAKEIKALQPQLEYNVAWSDMVEVIISSRMKRMRGLIVEAEKLRNRNAWRAAQKIGEVLDMLSEED